MKVLVTFAVDAEFSPWRALRPFKKTRLNPSHWSGGIEIHEAQIGDCTVWVFLTGIGIKSFDFAFASCLKDAGVNAVLSSGLAGSLKAEFGPEEIVAARRVGTIRDATGASAAAGLVLLAERRGAKIVDTLLTADHIIQSREEKNRLAIFGQAVDMESFHVMSTFIDESVPVAIIRAISDGSEEDLPVDFAKCLTQEGKVKSGPLLKELFGHPMKVPTLVRFGVQSRNAARKLASFLDGFVQALTPDVLSYETTEAAAR